MTDPSVPVVGRGASWYGQDMDNPTARGDVADLDTDIAEHRRLAEQYAGLAETHRRLAEGLEARRMGVGPAPGAASAGRTPAIALEAEPGAYEIVTQPPRAPALIPATSPLPEPLPVQQRLIPYSRLGVALEPLSAGSPGPLFTDVFHLGRGWIAGTETSWTDPRSTVDLDALGWPRAIPPGVVLRALFAWRDEGAAGPPRWPDSHYTIRWKGEGSFTLEANPNSRCVLRVDNSAQGIANFTYQAGHEVPCGFVLALRGTNPNNPIRDIEIVPTLGPQGGVWAAPVVEALQPFGHIHFGYATHTNPPKNAPPLRTWRAQVEGGMSPFWTGPEGVPYAPCIALANAARARPWFSLPDAVDAQFVAGLGRLLRRSSTADKIFIEAGLNPWRGLTGEVVPARVTQYVQNALTAARLLHGELGDRLRLVLTGRLEQPDILRTIVSTFRGVPTAQQLLPQIVLGVPAYLGHGLGNRAHWATLATMSLDEVFQQLDVRLELLKPLLANHVAIARAEGLPLVCPEGGPHLVADAEAPPVVQALFRAAGRDRRMGAVITKLLDAWAAEGGDAFTHYAFTGGDPRGAWGAVETFEPGFQANAPKYAALVAWAAQHRG